MTTANAEQYDAWNGDGGQRWVAAADRRDAVLAPIADLLRDAATVAAGERVLDIGCGCGAATLAAAAAGPAGHAGGGDLSAPMLGVARRRATGCKHRVPTGWRPDRPARRAIRRGDQPVRDHVLRRPNRGVRQHRPPPLTGRAAVHRHLATARGQRVAHRARRRVDHGSLPEGADPGGPGMFVQSDPGHIGAMLRDAGFAGIHSTSRTVELIFRSIVDEAVEYLADSGPGRAILDAIPGDLHDEALAAVRDALVPHHDPGTGVALGAAVLVTNAVRATLTPE